MNLYKFCFIFGPGRCGGKLLLSLFDNHNEIVALPFTLKPYHYFKKEKISANFEDLIKIIEEKTRFKLLKEKSIDPNLSFGNKNNLLYDHQIFRDELKKLISEKKTFTRKEIIENIYICYALAIKKDLKKVKYFIIDGIYHDYLDEINFDFKNYKSIFLIRDPREQLLSFLKLHHKINHSLYIWRKMNYLTHSIFSQKENYDLLEKLQNKNYKNLTIKFENLKKNPNNIMQEIANFLEIEFVEELIKPTLFGKIRTFETSFSKDPIIGLGKNNTKRLKIYLNKYQIIQSEMIFNDYIRRFNYSPTYYKNTFLIKLIAYIQPFKFEILPSSDSLKNNSNVTKYKNYFFYKLLKYIFYCAYNFICYFVNRFINFNYLKFYKNR